MSGLNPSLWFYRLHRSVYDKTGVPMYIPDEAVEQALSVLYPTDRAKQAVLEFRNEYEKRACMAMTQDDARDYINFIILEMSPADFRVFIDRAKLRPPNYQELLSILRQDCPAFNLPLPRELFGQKEVAKSSS